MFTSVLNVAGRSSLITILRSTTSCAKGNDLSYLYRMEAEPIPPEGVNLFVYNRNPRNLERLRLAHKMEGYPLEKLGRTYWHKINVKKASRQLTASIIHFSEETVMKCSTNEWCIRKLLSSATDKHAHILLGRIFARRCLESGIYELCSFYNPVPDTKLDLFLKEVENGGIALKEPARIHFPRSTRTKERPEVPWEVTEE